MRVKTAKAANLQREKQASGDANVLHREHRIIGGGPCRCTLQVETGAEETPGPIDGQDGGGARGAESRRAR
jgi:hypothetical protein